MSKKEATKVYEDMITDRNNADIEYAPKNLFEGRSFHQKEFNKQFEKELRRRKRKGETPGDRSLVEWGGIHAGNDYGASGGSDYVPITNNYGELYVEDKVNSSLYASRLDSPVDYSEESVGSESESPDEYGMDITAEERLKNMKKIESTMMMSMKNANIMINHGDLFWIIP